MRGRPEVGLIDASALGLDDAGLRRLARAHEAPFVSRSYRYPHAVVASWTSDVGVDVERVDEALDLQFARSIATPRERTQIDGASAADIASLWSAKEAVAKALGQPLARDPRRVEAPPLWRWSPPAKAAQSLGSPWWAQALTVPEGYVGWVVWRASGPWPERAAHDVLDESGQLVVGDRLG